MQQCVYQIKYRNVCEVRSDWYSLDWFGALSMPLSMNGESVSLPVFA